MKLACSPCPFGAVCVTNSTEEGDFGDIELEKTGKAILGVRPNYWAVGVPLRNSSASLLNQRKEVLVLPCPPQYCCASDMSQQIAGQELMFCPWRSSQACEGNRDPKVPFCGGCSKNYSHGIGGFGCIADDECGKASELGRYAFLLFLFSVLLCFFFTFGVKATLAIGKAAWFVYFAIRVLSRSSQFQH